MFVLQLHIVLDTYRCTCTGIYIWYVCCNLYSYVCVGNVSYICYLFCVNTVHVFYVCVKFKKNNCAVEHQFSARVYVIASL